jgi:IS30 family transposase
MSEPIGSGSYETIYQMIYVLPRDEIHREQISLLLQCKKLHRPVGKDRRGGGVCMTSIHELPAPVQISEIFSDWLGELIKSAES